MFVPGVKPHGPIGKLSAGSTSHNSHVDRRLHVGMAAAACTEDMCSVAGVYEVRSRWFSSFCDIIKIISDSYFHSLRRDGLMILPQIDLDSKVALKRLERAGRILWIVYNIGSRTPACWFFTAIGTSTITRAIDQYI